MTPPAGFLEHALAYATQYQWPVFPLRTADKVPLIAKVAGGHGCLDATTDPDRIEAWWRRWPDANVGLACGAAFWVLDVDQPDGTDTIVALQRRFGRLPASVRQRTGGLGWQLFFAPDPRVKNGVRILPGLDTRAGGGYVVAPPSIHPSGRAYRWLASPDEAEIAAAPAWLIALLEPVEPPPPPVSRRPLRPGNLRRYAAAALGRACSRISGAAPGEQCDTLEHQAYGIGRLIAGGVVPRAEAEAALVAAGCAMCSQAGRRPWTRREVACRVDRALTAGARSPRTPGGRS